MSQDFKKLKAKWYRKLKKSGFEDIEDIDSPKEFLIKWHSKCFQSHNTPEEFKERVKYFEQRTYFATAYTFSSPLEERVWCLHSDGYTYREIAKMTDSNKDKVNKIIKALTKVMRGY